MCLAIYAVICIAGRAHCGLAIDERAWGLWGAGMHFAAALIRAGAAWAGAFRHLDGGGRFVRESSVWAAVRFFRAGAVAVPRVGMRFLRSDGLRRLLTNP